MPHRSKLIVAFSGAVFLATVAGARRSDSAFERMKAETRAAQLRVFGPAIDHATLDRLRALPGVVEVGRGQQLVANVNGGFQAFGAVADDRLGRTVEVPRLLDGRRPHPDRADEVAVPETLANAMHLGVGDQLVVSGYSPAQVAALMSSRGQPPRPEGPEVRLRVVGITRVPSDLSIEGNAGGLLLATRAFLERYGGEIGTFAPVVLFVRLSDPAAASRVVEFLRRHAGSDSVASGEFQVQPSSEFEGGVEQSIDVLTTGLIVFAVVAGLAGLVVAAIVLRRVADGFGRDVPLLQSLGVSRRMRVVTVGLAAVPVALIGAALSVVGAFALSTAHAAGHRAPCGTEPGSQPRRRRPVRWVRGRCARHCRSRRVGGAPRGRPHRGRTDGPASPVGARPASDGSGSVTAGDGRDRDDARAQRRRAQRIHAYRRCRGGRRGARCRRGSGVRDEPRRAGGDAPCVRHQLGCRSRRR